MKRKVVSVLMCAAVSYTHLDVYKRQPISCIIPWIPLFGWRRERKQRMS